MTRQQASVLSICREGHRSPPTVCTRRAGWCADADEVFGRGSAALDGTNTEASVQGRPAQTLAIGPFWERNSQMTRFHVDRSVVRPEHVDPVVPITAKSPDAHMACCLALIEGAPVDASAEPLDRLVVID